MGQGRAGREGRHNPLNPRGRRRATADPALPRTKSLARSRLQRVGQRPAVPATAVTGLLRAVPARFRRGPGTLLRSGSAAAQTTAWCSPEFTASHARALGAGPEQPAERGRSSGGGENRAMTDHRRPLGTGPVPTEPPRADGSPPPAPRVQLAAERLPAAPATTESKPRPDAGPAPFPPRVPGASAAGWCTAAPADAHHPNPRNVPQPARRQSRPGPARPPTAPPARDGTRGTRCRRREQGKADKGEGEPAAGEPRRHLACRSRTSFRPPHPRCRMAPYAQAADIARSARVFDGSAGSGRPEAPASRPRQSHHMDIVCDMARGTVEDLWGQLCADAYGP